MASSRPTAVLFVCNLNRVRSPMAAALVRRRFGETIDVDSCGLAPADSVDPFAIAVIDEVGVDLSAHEPKSFAAVQDHPFDLVVSLTPETQEPAAELSRDRGVAFEYWPVDDPTLVEGARDQRIEAYRATRDALDRMIRGRFGSDA